MGYYFYHPSEHKLVVARNATFLEKEFLESGSHGVKIDLDAIKDTNESTVAQEHEMPIEQPLFDVLQLTQIVQNSNVKENRLINESTQEPEQPENQVVHESLRRSTRERHAPNRLNLLVQDDEGNHIDDIAHVDDDPRSFKEAMASQDHEKWLKAMELEMESLRINKVWTLVDNSKDKTHWMQMGV
ncbi:uncharacterized protein LOC141631517 [Silene latifolia]|uniref:uncharacterized protein LOC141631517 n=1 Tax=Silene latifolia TaxID=37657 RepID=UPI003D77CFCD